MMKKIVFIFLIIVLCSPAYAGEFFSTMYIETYRTNLGTTMVSPNIYFTWGKFDGYGFIDRYFTTEAFYHGEFMLAFTPFDGKYLSRISLISESRWDKYAEQENSIGFRIKLW